MARKSGRVALGCGLLLASAGCIGQIDAEPPAAAAAAPAATTPPSSTPPSSTRAACAPPARRLYRLTPAQLGRTLAALFGPSAVPADFVVALENTIPVPRPFANAEAVLSLGPGFYEAYLAATKPLAAAVASAPAGLHPCFAKGTTSECVAAMLADLGARAWRRPWTADEVAAYRAFYDATAARSSPAQALALTLRRLLVSPEFLLRSEAGEAVPGGAGFRLTPYETASALSYTLTDGPPDAELTAAAARGDLRDRDSVERQVRRLLAQASTAPGVIAFFADLIDLAAAAHPDQPDEARRLVAGALWDGGGSLSALLTAPYTYVTPALLKFYGWPATGPGPAQDWIKVTPPASEARSGLLTLGAFLGRFTNRSARGRFVKERLFCSKIPDPPADVVPDLETERQKVQAALGRPATEDEARAAHMANPACSSCHTLIDPLGKPLVAFDRRGVFLARDVVTGKPIDTSSELVATGDADGPVGDPRALGRALAGSAAAGKCFGRQVVQYVLGREPTDADRCQLEEATAAFDRSAGDVRELFVEVLASDRLRQRRLAN